MRDTPTNDDGLIRLGRWVVALTIAGAIGLIALAAWVLVLAWKALT